MDFKIQGRLRRGYRGDDKTGVIPIYIARRNRFFMQETYELDVLMPVEIKLLLYTLEFRAPHVNQNGRVYLPEPTYNRLVVPEFPEGSVIEGIILETMPFENEGRHAVTIQGVYVAIQNLAQKRLLRGCDKKTFDELLRLI